MIEADDFDDGGGLEFDNFSSELRHFSWNSRLSVWTRRNSAKSSSGVMISDTKSNEIISDDTRDFKFGLTDFCVCLIIGRRDE